MGEFRISQSLEGLRIRACGAIRGIEEDKMWLDLLVVKFSDCVEGGLLQNSETIADTQRLHIRVNQVRSLF